MLSTIFNERLQNLRKSEKYPEPLLMQLEDIASKNGGKLPKNFLLKDAGRATISSVLKDLGMTKFNILVANGHESSEREIVSY